jgi:hypothetical protein
MSTPVVRADLIAGLRALADFLAAHPDAPTPRHVHAVVWADGENNGPAVVDQVAAMLDTEPGGTEHYTVERDFGRGVTYAVVHIPAAVREAHNARHSYTDAVQL